MKKSVVNFLFFMMTAVMLFFAVGCTVPSPLYGTWSDNAGNQITFLNDGTFSATIYIPKDNPGEDEEPYVEEAQGTYNAVDNALIINTTIPKQTTINTEWDLRGAMLYLTWTVVTDGDSVKSQALTLYHNSK